MSDFNDDFHPENGDLLYGKAKTRKRYLDRWKSGWSEKDFVIVDNLNNALHIDRVSSYRDLESLRRTLKKNSEEAGLSGVKQVPPYQDALSKSRFSPATVFNEDAQKIARGGEKTLVRDKAKGNLVSPSGEEMELGNRARLGIKRACKFGIAYVATNENLLGTNAKILYAIDDLDFEVIVEKRAITRDRYEDTLVPKGGGTSSQVLQYVKVKETTAIPITTSELRYIYRHWSALKGKVLWYVNHKRMNCAPWEGPPASVTDCFSGQVKIGEPMWSSYAGHLLSKATRKQPGNLFA